MLALYLHANVFRIKKSNILSKAILIQGTKDEKMVCSHGKYLLNSHRDNTEAVIIINKFRQDDFMKK